MGDMIERQAAIDALRMDISIIPYAKAREYVRAAIETIYNRIEELPSAQPEQKVGKWESQKGGGYKCSECGQYALDRIEGNYVHVAATTPYCPNCGAKMEEQDDRQRKSHC